MATEPATIHDAMTPAERAFEEWERLPTSDPTFPAHFKGHRKHVTSGGIEAWVHRSTRLILVKLGRHGEVFLLARDGRTILAEELQNFIVAASLAVSSTHPADFDGKHKPAPRKPPSRAGPQSRRKIP